jgi:aminoacrylate hydrolase
MPVAVRDGADLKSRCWPGVDPRCRAERFGKWWDPNRFALAERFTVSFDQRGTGRSSKIPVASIEQMAADLIGHSTGSGIGVATVLDFPDRLRSLLICCSTTCGDPYRQKLLGLRRRLYEQLGGEAYAQFRTLLLYPPYWINEHHQELAAEEAGDGADLGGPDVQASRLNAILAFDRRAQFHRITVPTLVVGADDDLLAPRYFSEEYIRLIPRARAHVARRGGHALTKTEADLFNRIALEFFTEFTP